MLPWDDAEWLADVVSWIDERVRRTGDVELVRTRPWAAVARVSTGDGVVWFKEAAPQLAFEPALTELVAETRHPFAPDVIAADGPRLLTPHAGPNFRDSDAPVPWEEVMRQYAELQLLLVDRVGAALATGAPDKRPLSLPRAYADVLDRAELPTELLARLRRLEPRVVELAEEVGDVVPSCVVHEEVHQGNVFAGDRLRLLDWGEGAVAHAFAGLPNTLRSAVEDRGLEPGGPEVERLCDAYLEPWTRYAPLTRLRGILRPAYALGCLGRMLLWDTVLHGLPPERRDEFDEPIPGWLGLWADAAEGRSRLGEELVRLEPLPAAYAARTWVDAWAYGWRTHDPGPIVARYAPGATFRSHPFRQPEEPRAYVERVFAEEQAEPEIWFGEPIAAGDRAAVEYRAILVYDGREHTLAGTTVLRFDHEGLVVDHLDYWALEEGRRPLPSDR